MKNRLTTMNSLTVSELERGGPEAGSSRRPLHPLCGACAQAVSPGHVPVCRAGADATAHTEFRAEARPVLCASASFLRFVALPAS